MSLGIISPVTFPNETVHVRCCPGHPWLHTQVMSYCTRFDGSYTDTGGRHQVVDVGGKYRLRVFMHGPVSLADKARKVTARVDEVSWAP